MDFTVEKYRELLEALEKHKSFSLRHDVDLRPDFSLRLAKVEAEMGLKATYYFRTVPESYDEEIIRQIVSLGHTAGYHYECLTTCNGNKEAAYEDFCRNLEKLRRVVPITTACAHGSPRSPWDSQDLFESKSRRVEESKSRKDEETKRRKDEETKRRKVKETKRRRDEETKRQKVKETKSSYDIHSLGIEYEPMLDTDFSKTLYLTDTGRRWDGCKVSVRDKVPQYHERWIKEGLVFHTTDDIIHALRNPEHPIHKYGLLVNTHPQRWMPFSMGWLKEAMLQNLKNIIKRFLVSKE